MKAPYALSRDDPDFLSQRDVPKRRLAALEQIIQPSTK